MKESDINRITTFESQSHEHTKYEQQSISQVIVPNQKIKVFISSICGNEKYDTVRAKLKKAIDDTQLAIAYIFEGESASTLSAGNHYTFALEDSDVCIFLIDNADGITPGVQKEIDTVQKYKIKALYYFCDENSKEKTALEQSLIGAKFAKSKTIHSFNDLSREGAYGLINDITTIYHYYCEGKLTKNAEESHSEYQEIDVSGTENLQMTTMPKSILKKKGLLVS